MPVGAALAVAAGGSVKDEWTTLHELYTGSRGAAEAGQSPVPQLFLAVTAGDMSLLFGVNYWPALGLAGIHGCARDKGSR